MTGKALALREFGKMTTEQQLDLLHRDGVYIGKRKLEQQTVVLFQLHSFYVEVFYRKYRREIDYLLTSSGTDILLPYIDQVHVRDLK